MSRKLMCTLLAIFLVYSIIFVGTLIRNNLKKYDTIGRADAAERTLAVEAEGKVTVNQDIIDRPCKTGEKNGVEVALKMTIID
jgi:hypothetical protein